MLTRIILFSDPHDSQPMESRRALLDKRLFGMLNSRVFRKHLHEQELLSRAVTVILERKPDVVVFTGDATSYGQPGEFAASEARLRPLLESGLPLIYTPGNHDVYVRDAACRAALERFYRVMNRGRVLSVHPESFRTGGLEFISVHCARPTSPVSSCGYMSAETCRELRILADLPHDTPRVLCGHFPVLEQHPLLRIRHRLWGAGRIAALIKSGVIDLSLCGHVHKHYQVLSATGRGESCAGSVTREGGMTEIVYDSDTGKFTFRRISLKKN